MAVKFTAIVPARSGSKRLANKNIKLLGGRPLLTWTLAACAETAKIDKVILSTDSEEYWKLAQDTVPSDKLALDFRTPDEAGDTVKIFDYLKQSREKIFGDSEGAFILTLPTVPLRTSRHISEAIAQFEKTGRPVFSATNYGFPVTFAFTMTEDLSWQPMLPESPMVTGNTRSQNQKAAYHPNGAIYVRKISDLAKPDLKTLYDAATPYLMSREHSVDIDQPVDFAIAEAIFNNQKN
jgi:CMP-N,N'-diacetyllegionaminic acid synthase